MNKEYQANRRCLPNFMLVANSKTEPEHYREQPRIMIDFTIRHQYLNSKFWHYMGGFLTILQVSHRKPGTASRAERALFWQGAKPFLHPIARSAAHVMSKIAPIEFQRSQAAQPHHPTCNPRKCGLVLFLYGRSRRNLH